MKHLNGRNAENVFGNGGMNGTLNVVAAFSWSPHYFNHYSTPNFKIVILLIQTSGHTSETSVCAFFMYSFILYLYLILKLK